MGTHPNAMLILRLTPDDLARKTYRAILEEAKVEGDDEIKIGGFDYTHMVMESDYDESFQISAKEGEIVLHDFLTYGYGESMAWEKVESQKNDLEAWAKGICERHKCSYKIEIGANYW